MITCDPQHIYRNEKGEIYPSVTQHLVIAGLVDFSMVKPEDLAYAATRGKFVHEALHMYIYDDLDVASLPLEYRSRVMAGIKFLKESGIEVWNSEEIVWDDILRTAGCPDLVGDLHDSGGLGTVVEFKTPATLPPTTELQLSAYKLLWEIKNRRCIQWKKAVLLKPNGSYSIKEFRDESKNIFLGIVRANWYALNHGFIPIGAKTDENVYNLCREIIGK